MIRKIKRNIAEMQEHLKRQRYEPRGGIIYTQEEEREAERKAIASGAGVGAWQSFLPKKEPSTDRRASAPRGLARLDAQGISALCEILADVLDMRRFYFYEGEVLPDDNATITETGANDERLEFITEVKRRIVQRAAPATGGK